PISKQLLDRVGKLSDRSIEEMIGAVDDDQLFGFGRLRVEFTHHVQRAELVALRLDEKLGLPADTDRVEIVPSDRRRYAGERRNTPVLVARDHADPGTVRHASRPQLRGGIAIVHEVECRTAILHFARAIAETSLAGAGAPEVEAQHRAADPRQ